MIQPDHRQAVVHLDFRAVTNETKYHYARVHAHARVDQTDGNGVFCCVVLQRIVTSERDKRTVRNPEGIKCLRSSVQPN